MPSDAAPHGVKPTDLPMPPQAAIRALEACSKPEISSRELSDIVSADPLLTAEILRIANSAFFGATREIRAVAHAITVMGPRALRNLVLCVMVRDVMRHQSKDGVVDVSGLMDDMLRRAVCSRCLAEWVGADSNECFTQGLLQDIGLLALFHVQPQHAPLWEKLRSQDPASRYQLERHVFGETHDQFGATLARNWGLPKEIAAVIAGHHAQPQPADEPVLRLLKIAECADWMAAVFTATDKAAVLRHSTALLEKHFRIEAGKSPALMRKVTESITAAADMLGMRIGHSVDLTELLNRASAMIAEEAVSYQEHTWELERAVAEKDKITAELRKELEIGRTIQAGFLPTSLPQVANWQIAAYFQAAREVSGDFYDVFEVPKLGRLALMIGDVCGKGVGAALFMTLFRSLLRATVTAEQYLEMPGATQSKPGPSVAPLVRGLQLTNEYVADVHGSTSMFATLFIGLLDVKTGHLQYANCGHEAPLIVNAGRLRARLEATGPAVGIIPGAAHRTAEFTFQPGDTLAAFTDGAIDARDSHGKSFTAARLESVVSAAKGPARPLVESIREQLRQFAGEAVQYDDITLLAVTRGSAGGHSGL